MTVNKRFKIVTILLFCGLLVLAACNIEPTNPGKAKDNFAPETFIGPTPAEGSMNNPFRLRIQWRGNDRDGRIKEFQYRIEGPLYDNTWITTPKNYQDFKLPLGFYTLQVRAVDDNGAIDETPAQRKFHVLGPTQDQGVLVIDDDASVDDDKDQRKDVLMDSILIRSGFHNFTMWDYETKFGVTESIVFTGKGTDLNGEEYSGLSAFSTVIWHTGPGDEHDLSRNTKLLSDYLDTGGNLLIAGSLVMKSILGDTARGGPIATNSFARNYLKIRRAKAAIINTDVFLSTFPGYPDIESKYVVPTSGLTVYLKGVTDQLVPTTDADIIYTFSHSIYKDDRFAPVVVNSEEFVGTPIAVRYVSQTYKVITLGFPLVRATKRGRRYRNNIMNEDQIVEMVRHILVDEFGETPN